MKLTEFLDVFCHRTTPYALQQKDGSYRKVDSVLTRDILRKHISGKLTLGTYTISEDNTCRYLCIDVDDKNKFDLVERKLKEFKVPFVKEITGGRGLHFWIVFEEPTNSEDVYALGQRLKECIDDKLEVFPKQPKLEEGELGNLVKVPLGIHQKYGGKSQFNKQRLKYTRVQDVILPQPEAKPKKKIKFDYSKTQMPCTKKMMQGCGEGQRDETALRLAVRFYRTGLPKSVAYKLLQKFNSKCSPSLSDRTLEIKLEQGYKGKYGLGCTSDLIKQYCDSSCKLYNKIRKVSYKEDELIPDKGFLKYYMKYNSNNDAPRIFHLMTGLMLISSIVKNNIWSRPFGGRKLYPNLYTLFVAPSGHRKTTSIDIGKDLLIDFDDDLLFPDSIASYEAFLACFTDQPQATFFLSEFSRFMRRLTRENMGGVKDILTELYDCPPFHRVFSKGEDHTRIENPCYNIFAAATPVYLEGNTKPEDWQEGWMSRFIVINAMRTELKGLSSRTDKEDIMKRKIIKWFGNLERMEGEFDFGEVQEELDKEIEKYSSNGNELLTGFYERVTGYLIKFSMLYHLSMNNNLRVSKKSFEYARKLLAYIEQTYLVMLNDLSLTRESKDINKVYRIIKEAKDYGIGRSRLLQRSNFYSNKLTSIIITLKESNKIREEKTKFGAYRYYAKEKK